MTGAAHHLADAALPVAIGLLVLALAARAALWAPADSARLRALAREHLAPLSTWCLVATGLYTVAVGATGDAGALAFAVPVVIAVAAVALRTPGDETESEPAAPPAERPHPATPPPAAPRSLWTEPDGGARTGLWSR